MIKVRGRNITSQRSEPKWNIAVKLANIDYSFADNYKEWRYATNRYYDNFTERQLWEIYWIRKQEEIA